MPPLIPDICSCVVVVHSSEFDVISNRETWQQASVDKIFGCISSIYQCNAFGRRAVRSVRTPSLVTIIKSSV